MVQSIANTKILTYKILTYIKKKPSKLNPIFNSVIAWI